MPAVAARKRKMIEFFLEIASEEIPPRMQKKSLHDLEEIFCKNLAKMNLSYEKSKTYITSRRMALIISGLPIQQQDVVEEKRGPGVYADKKAITGFLKSNSISINQCIKKSVKGKEYYFATITNKGSKTEDIIEKILDITFKSLVWPKSMRWGEGSDRWVRPIKNLVCIFNGKTVPFSYASIDSTNVTTGHRFLNPKSFVVKDSKGYISKLYQSKVIIDQEKRKKTLEDQLKKKATEKKLSLALDDSLLEELNGLVEWPVVFTGSINPSHMKLPEEIIISVLQKQQKYIPLLKKDKKISQYFLIVCDREEGEYSNEIVSGNERVLSARLEDASFFWKQDVSTPLEDFVPELKKRTFHSKLGSMEEKRERMTRLALAISDYISEKDVEKVKRACFLAKADLNSQMVNQFPELQGIIGGLYSEFDKEDPSVVAAIAEHYSPIGPKDQIPSSSLGTIISLADKIDNLLALFSIGEKPTGSKDPFALRRSALGIIRIILKKKIKLPLLKILKQSNFNSEKLAVEILDFLKERLKVFLRESGFRHDFVDAVYGVKEDDLTRLMQRMNAIKAFIQTKEGADLLAAFHRASSILSSDQKNGEELSDIVIDSSLLVEKEEKQLFRTLSETIELSREKLRSNDYEATMALFSKLRQPLDNFFDNVMVNCEDQKVKLNRLRLLSSFCTTVSLIADFSKIRV